MAETPSVGFLGAIKLYFANYTNFSGRSRRSEYWWIILFVNIIAFLLGFLLPEIAGIWTLVTFLPSLSLCIRRLHDTGHSGWYYFFCLIPIAGFFILLFWFCSDSTEDNQWGPNPKKTAVPSLPHRETYVDTKTTDTVPADFYAPPPVNSPVITLSLCSGPMAGMNFTCHAGNYVVLGRAPSKCDIVLPPPYNLVSGVHCQIACYDGYVTVTDLGSTNGTFVNGTALAPQQPFPAQNGAIIYLASSNCAFRVLFS